MAVYSLAEMLDKLDGLLDSGENGLKAVFYNRVKYGDIPIERADLKVLQEMNLLSELGKPTNNVLDDEAITTYMIAKMGKEPPPP